jgi:DNA invertase Pin-like site-specific DNA recombinase
MQRDGTEELAEELGVDELDSIDLGIHTGFSAFTRPSKESRIDTHPEVRELVETLRSGAYDYILAHDDTRIARDDYFFVVQYAAIVGGAEFVFVDETNMESLGFRVTRVVEQFVKMREMERAAQALAHRAEQGMDHGQPPHGLQYDDEGEYWVVDPTTVGDVEKVFRLRSEGLSYREIADRTPLSKSAVGKLLDRSESYERFLDLPDIEG